MSCAVAANVCEKPASQESDFVLLESLNIDRLLRRRCDLADIASWNTFDGEDTLGNGVLIDLRATRPRGS